VHGGGKDRLLYYAGGMVTSSELHQAKGVQGGGKEDLKAAACSMVVGFNPSGGLIIPCRDLHACV